MFNSIYSPPADTGLGNIYIYADDVGITGIEFEPQRPRSDNQPERSNDAIELCKQQLAEYFDNKRTEFTVPLHLIGTPFQIKVWEVLMKIPYGTAWSYKQQACELGSANYTRAVGHANSKNPVSIIVPCHRVIGTNKKLTGYAGGLDRKKALLRLENCPFCE